MKTKRSLLQRMTACLVMAGTLAYAQSSTDGSQSAGWRRVGNTAPSAYQTAPPPNAADSQAPAVGTAPGSQAYPSNNWQPTNGQPGYQAPPPPAQTAPSAPIAAQLQVPAGTFVTIRTNSMLSSDRNHPGDAFSATLAQPLVVNGVVVAEPGQTVSGQVVEAEKAGRVEGVARLRIQLTELTLVDGQQIPIQGQLIGRQGPTSVGRDAGAVAGTTGLGAALGAAVGWGRGAAIGAGAGAAVGALGVLLTRGRPSVIYPEEVLTFRLEAPLTIDTQHSAQAFRYVQPNEYNQPLYNQPQTPPQPPSPPPAPVIFGAPYPYPWGYPYYSYGPSVSFFYGRGWYGPGWYGRGWYGRGWYGPGWRRWR